MSRRHHLDRADLAAMAVFGIAANAVHGWLLGQMLDPQEVRDAIAAVLRDEFNDVERIARGEREPPTG